MYAYSDSNYIIPQAACAAETGHYSTLIDVSQNLNQFGSIIISNDRQLSGILSVRMLHRNAHHFTSPQRSASSMTSTLLRCDLSKPSYGPRIIIPNPMDRHTLLRDRIGPRYHRGLADATELVAVVESIDFLERW